jgi:DNA repair protein RecN (Recombination protein N)
MLTRLHVSNLAVLDAVELELADGFTVLTGETGAGKSMLVDALALALGERADSQAVRAGAARAEIAAVFAVAPGSPAAGWLAARDLGADDECQLRRVVTAEGRSRAYVNGQPVPVEQLRELGGLLVEICGQHAHQSLAERPAQRDILDAHGRHASLLAEYAVAHAAWRATVVERETLERTRRERDDRRELLRFQLGELEALGLRPGEVEELEQERTLLANVGRITVGVAAALERLHDADEGSASDAIGAALRDVEALAALDPGLAEAAALLEQSRIHLGEAADVLRRRLAGIEHDPARQDEVETRLATASDLARKHRVEPAALCALAEELAAEASRLAASGARDEDMAREEAARHAALGQAASALHRARVAAATSLAAAVTANLRTLGMPGATMEVRVTALPLAQGGPAGADQVEFLIATNAGQPPGPVARVASGGELSRLNLAVQLVALAERGPGTLIFDEVDAGVGGGVAEIVGASLKRLSARRQVLCVTHLPQVASLAHHHFAVAKRTKSEATRTTITPLQGDDRIEEIARMLGGVRITERTREHAREMVSGGRKRRAG